MVSSSPSTPGPSLRVPPAPKRAPTSQPVTPGAHGLRGHLKQLLPRHTLFAVHLVIHDLSSVPLVHGDFGVRWRFKNVQSAPPGVGGVGSSSSHRLLDRMRGGSRTFIPTPASSSLSVSSTKSTSSVWKGKGRAVERTETPGELGTRPGAEGILINVVDATPDHESDHTRSLHRHEEEDDEDDSSPYFAPGTAASISTHSLHANLPAQNGESSDEGRGSTLYFPLRDHAVSWEQIVDVVVQMGVARDTNDLLQNEMKLVVQQLVIPGDPDAPANPRLGSVSLNLAEYADKGPVTRKYLLQHSKTNALLKMTIHCTHVGGHDTYIAPPLHKGEVMAGITGLLANTVPFVPALFPAIHHPSTAFSRPAATETLPTSLSASTSSLHGSSSSSSRSDSLPFAMPPSPYTPSRGVPFSLSAAAGPASASGPLATRDLIEALFNPVPSTSTQPSPFTYFDPAAAAEAEAARVAQAAAAEAERASADAASEHASEESSQPSTSQGRGRHWWKPRKQKTLPLPLVGAHAPLRPPTRNATGSFIRISTPLPIDGGITLNLGKA